jgi:hypothetical protein
MIMATWRGTDFTLVAMNYRIMVSPRAGPTLTMDNFAPVSSEIRFT